MEFSDDREKLALARMRSAELSVHTEFLTRAIVNHEYFVQNIDAAWTKLKKASESQNLPDFNKVAAKVDPPPPENLVRALRGMVEGSATRMIDAYFPQIETFIDALKVHVTRTQETKTDCDTWTIRGADPGDVRPEVLLESHSEFTSAWFHAVYPRTQSPDWQQNADAVFGNLFIELQGLDETLADLTKDLYEGFHATAPDWGNIKPEWIDQVEFLAGEVYQLVYSASSVRDQCLEQLNLAAAMEERFLAQLNQIAVAPPEGNPMPLFRTESPEQQEKRERREKARVKKHKDPARRKEFENEFEIHPQYARAGASHVATFNPTDDERDEWFGANPGDANKNGIKPIVLPTKIAECSPPDGRFAFAIRDDKLFIFPLGYGILERINGEKELTKGLIGQTALQTAPDDDNNYKRVLMLHHSSLVGGASVTMAGELKLEGSGSTRFITEVGDRSGHYMEPREAADFDSAGATERGLAWFLDKQLIAAEKAIFRPEATKAKGAWAKQEGSEPDGVTVRRFQQVPNDKARTGIRPLVPQPPPAFLSSSPQGKGFKPSKTRPKTNSLGHERPNREGKVEPIRKFGMAVKPSSLPSSASVAKRGKIASGRTSDIWDYLRAVLHDENRKTLGEARGIIGNALKSTQVEEKDIWDFEDGTGDRYIILDASYAPHGEALLLSLPGTIPQLNKIVDAQALEKIKPETWVIDGFTVKISIDFPRGHTVKLDFRDVPGIGKLRKILEKLASAEKVGFHPIVNEELPWGRFRRSLKDDNRETLERAKREAAKSAGSSTSLWAQYPKHGRAIVLTNDQDEFQNFTFTEEFEAFNSLEWLTAKARLRMTSGGEYVLEGPSEQLKFRESGRELVAAAESMLPPLAFKWI
ncbi:hypothetical protein [Streptomyces sp. NPDC126514]|uniref:hypothetical protein n=1 Tax=Streptomyces sp. NPDC126514 TaxID=3155210 RepID=UPI00332F45B8